MVAVCSDIFLLFLMVLYTMIAVTSMQMVAVIVMTTATLAAIASVVRFPMDYCNVPSKKKMCKQLLTNNMKNCTPWSFVCSVHTSGPYKIMF